MKKVFAFILALALCVTLVACGESKEASLNGHASGIETTESKIETTESKEVMLDKELQGAWISSDDDNLVIMELQFHNGTFELSVTLNGIRYDGSKGTYEIGDGVIYLKHDDGDTEEITYAKEYGVLVLSHGFTKKD